jgi:uncharacterized protein with ParB-like and HNH nuclease domain
MMNEVIPLTLKELFNDIDQYVIPIYQREYAWGYKEINQLIDDINDARNSKTENYYIGSLVVFDKGFNKYDVIDGQQRYTTLCILIAVLKNDFHKLVNDSMKVSLGFEARDVSTKTLRSLYENGADNNKKNAEDSMISAYDDIKIKLKELEEKQGGLNDFFAYFQENVCLLRVKVPSGTDVSSYFEIMNNRGEQLEKHEILKPSLMSYLTKDEQKTFAKIWDYCADMNCHIQRKFSIDQSSEIFDKEILFDYYTKLFKCGVENSENSENLKDILKKPLRYDNKLYHKNQDDSVKSIIDFPNFLLHVLSISIEDGKLIIKDKSESVSLDDKKLIESFDKVEWNECTVKSFSEVLLKCRSLFDKYIIKRSAEKEWRLEQIFIDQGQRKLKNTFADEEINKEVIMAISMLEVSFYSNNYKNWLKKVLSWLYNQKNIVPHDYCSFLQEIRTEVIHGYFESFDGLNKSLDKGTSVNRFVFNLLDYLIWNEDRNDHNDFHFSYKNSIEHHYPQNPFESEGMNSKKINDNDLNGGCDNFGNLCLVSGSENSRLSNRLPTEKKGHKPSSLKQKLMMKYDVWDNTEVGLENIKSHREKMIGLLKTCYD